MQNLTLEEQAILAHVVSDPQEWIDNALANNLAHAIPEKIEKYRQEYLDAKYLPDGKENPDYKTRAERDALEEAKRKERLDKAKADNDAKITEKLAGKPDMKKKQSLDELQAAVKWLYEYLGIKT